MKTSKSRPRKKKGKERKKEKEKGIYIAIEGIFLYYFLNDLLTYIK